MSQSRGEGRSNAEKGQRVIEPRAVTRERRARARAEEAEWEAKAGPVEVLVPDLDGHDGTHFKCLSCAYLRYIGAASGPPLEAS